LETFTEKIEYLSEDLKQGRPIKIKSSEVLQKIGEIFTMRHMVNLNSNFLDTPEFYWENYEYESLYTSLNNHLTINKRMRLINDKLSYSLDLMQLLKQQLGDDKHTRLEWIIIILIAIEVFIGLGLLDRIKRTFL
jgi:required for meiotic nuclear division protein 1